MCKSSRDGSELKRTLQIVQPNIDLVASTHFLQTFSAHRQRENLALKLVRWLDWRVSELHEGVSCRPDVLKCFGLLVKQRRSQCYAPTTAQTIILAMLH